MCIFNTLFVVKTQCVIVVVVRHLKKRIHKTKLL